LLTFETAPFFVNALYIYSNDNVFVLKQLSIGKEVHLLFIDLEKAYDNIPLIKLWKAL